MIDKKLLDELSAATRVLAAAKARSKTAFDEMNAASREEREASERHAKALQAVSDAA